MKKRRMTFLAITALIFMNAFTCVTATAAQNVDYGGMCEPYIPSTGIINPPAVIAQADAEEDIEKLAASDKPAAVVLLKNDELLNGALEKLYGKVIPAVYLENAAEADSLVSFLNDTSVGELIVASEDPGLVGTVRAAHRHVRGAIDFKEKDVSLDEAVATVNRNCAKIAMFDSELSRDEIAYLQARLITVWTPYTAGETFSGTNGVVAENFDSAMAEIESQRNLVLVRRPQIAGHRGIPALKQENSLAGAIEAVKQGASIVENDVYLTADGQIVIMHNETLDGMTNGSGNIESMTLAEIQKYQLIGTPGAEPEPIPSLEEYFVRFKGTDVVHFVEIKSQKPELVEALKNLVEKYDVARQLAVISFYPAQIERVRELLPEISTGYLMNPKDVTGGNMQEKLQNVIDKIGPSNSTFNPDQSIMTEEFCTKLNIRGVTVWPWTINSATAIAKGIINGYNGITTNTANETSEYPYQLNVADKSINLTVGQTERCRPEAELVLQNGTVRSLKYGAGSNNVSAVVIDGDFGIIELDSNRLLPVKAGSCTIVFKYIGSTYSLYSQPVTVMVAEGEPIVPEKPDDGKESSSSEEKEDNGCGSAIGAGSIIGGSCAAAAAVCLQKKRRGD